MLCNLPTDLPLTELDSLNLHTTLRVCNMLSLLHLVLTDERKNLKCS